MTETETPELAPVEPPGPAFRLAGRAGVFLGSPRGRLSLLAAGVALALLVVGALRLALGGEEKAVRLVPRADVGAGDPLEFDPEQASELEAAAAFGFSHVLYDKSPGGVLATAKRTARFRPLVEAAVAGTGVDPDTLEAIVFLESAGRSEVIAGNDPAAAAGLTQIVAETAVSFLGMRVDLAESRRLTRQIAAATARGQSTKARRLRERRQRIDQRFDPAQALAGTVRYLVTARKRFGLADLAAVSYHMGIGNLERVLRAYAGASGGAPIARVVRDGDLSYARVYFDSSPIRHGPAWVELRQLGDSSRDYYWRVLAAREIMRLFREDRAGLVELDELHGHKASAEEVLHPPGATERFARPDDVAAAWKRGDLQALPVDGGRFHVLVDPQAGELARPLGKPPELYRGLRPEALALLLYLAARVYEISGDSTPLVVTSTVRDDAYQRLLAAETPDATRAYSLHTTGFAFDILRRYGSRAQAVAFQSELERLQARGLIAWVREAAAIHVTVASEASVLVPSLLESAG